MGTQDTEDRKARGAEERAKGDTLLRTGLIGTIIAALCCFTPILVILLGAMGLSALVSGLDFVLLPALAIFVSITIYALWRKQRTT